MLPPSNFIITLLISLNGLSPSKRELQKLLGAIVKLKKGAETELMLIPCSEKMDKALLLGSVVDHVRDLKVKTAEASEVLNLNTPIDIDEVVIEHLNEEENKGVAISRREKMILKASFCCDDRPELFSELHRAIKNLKLTLMEADTTNLGGRIKGVFLFCPSSDNSAKDVCMNSLKQSLRVVLFRIASTSNYRIKSKRQRFFLPPHKFS